MAPERFYFVSTSFSDEYKSLDHGLLWAVFPN